MTVLLRQDVRRVVLGAAADEARRRGSGRIGTQDLLLGILRDPTSEAVAILDVDLAAARSAVDRLDRDALASIGVDLGPVELRPRRAVDRRRPPFTSGCRAALARAVRLTRAEERDRVEMRHLVVALLATDRPDPAGDVLDELHIDREAARDRADGRS